MKNTVSNGNVTKVERSAIQLSCSDEENKWYDDLTTRIHSITTTAWLGFDKSG